MVVHEASLDVSLRFEAFSYTYPSALWRELHDSPCANTMSQYYKRRKEESMVVRVILANCAMALLSVGRKQDHASGRW